METCCVLLTGRAGAGKSTVGRAIVEHLRARDQPVVLLDDEEVRAYLADGDAARLAAIAWLCRELVTSGATPVIAADLPSRSERDQLRDAVPRLVEIYLDAPSEAPETGGYQDPAYQDPLAPDLRVPTQRRQPAASAAQVVSFLEAEGFSRE